MTQEKHPIPTVDDVQVFESAGPWNSKSGGKLRVQYALPVDVVQKLLLTYDETELSEIPADIRGLRNYSVRGIPQGSIGANEWHKVRTELVLALEGRVRWICEDVYGHKKEFELDGGSCILVPPYLLHTYQAVTENCGLEVLANTLFIPDDPRTHDTYSLESFHELQKQYDPNHPQ